MKAVVVQSIGNTIVTEVPEPVIGEYDALCEMVAASVCSGTDNHIVHGHTYQNPQYPLILGHEAIGRVIACGPKVRYLKIGDLVTRIMNRLPEGSGYHLQWGAFAQRGIATDWQAMRDGGRDVLEWFRYIVQRVLPDGIDPIEACMIITWRETHAFLKQMGISGKLLIIGSGTQAMAFMEHARNRNIEAVIVGDPNRKDLFTNAGAKLFISYRDDYVSLLHSAGYAPFNAVIDAVGKSRYLNSVLPLLTRGGKVGVYGLDEADSDAVDRGGLSGDVEYYAGDQYNEGASHDEVIVDMQKRKLNPWNYLSREHIYPLEKINEALEACRTRKVLKSVIVSNL